MKEDEDVEWVAGGWWDDGEGEGGGEVGGCGETGGCHDSLSFKRGEKTVLEKFS